MKTINKSLSEKVLKEGVVLGKKYRYELKTSSGGEKYITGVQIGFENIPGASKIVYFF